MAKKFDGVIEAVRCKNGQISCARAYERRGVVFSDYVLLDRKALVERLQAGKRYVVGQREEFLANQFKTGKQVLLVKKDGKEILSTRPDAAQDELEGALFF